MLIQIHLQAVILPPHDSLNTWFNDQQPNPLWHYIKLDLDGGPLHSFMLFHRIRATRAGWQLQRMLYPQRSCDDVNHLKQTMHRLPYPRSHFPSLLATDNYSHVISTLHASGNASSPCITWFNEPTTNLGPPVNTPLHSIGPGWWSSTFTLYCCAGSNHQKWTEITEDAVTTAKLPWCKPLKQSWLWLTYLGVILPTCLITTDNYPHVNSNSHASVDSDSAPSQWCIKHVVQWPNLGLPSHSMSHSIT